MKKSKSSEPRHRVLVPDWPDSVKFDETKKVQTIDANGKRGYAYGPILPRSVWNDTGLRYVVQFNNINQSIEKEGSVLVKFLGDIAKKEAFCPVGVKTWHKLNNQFKADIIKLVRGHFVIPDAAIFNKAILKRTGKAWRLFRYSLKESHFDPKRTRDQNKAKVPDGVSKQNWVDLVDYWLSLDVQKKKKGEFSELEFYESVYTKKDGSLKEGTISQQFPDDARAKVKENLATSSKSKVDIENQVFNELMYGEEVPKRPLNYGFGVKQSDVFGVQFLRNEECGYANNSVVEVENLKAQLSLLKKQNENLELKNQVLEAKFDQNNQTFKMAASYLAEVLKEVRNGNASSEILVGAETALNMINSEMFRMAMVRSSFLRTWIFLCSGSPSYEDGIYYMVMNDNGRQNCGRK